MANVTIVKPPKVLYNVVQVQQNTKMRKISKCSRVAHYLNAFAKVLQKAFNKDDKRHKNGTTKSTTNY